RWGKWRRQHPLGPYVVDFVCLAHHHIIEVDDGQHNDEVLLWSPRQRILVPAAPA
ncbi:MAG: DUF559 domain-containing protein, partial [Chloroflexi bacterium]|nr:DUF559 domain-containing protein [Chloroflexota bacterium]